MLRHCGRPLLMLLLAFSTNVLVLPMTCDAASEAHSLAHPLLLPYSLFDAVVMLGGMVVSAPSGSAGPTDALGKGWRQCRLATGERVVSMVCVVADGSSVLSPRGTRLGPKCTVSHPTRHSA
jgi:hypothetical protein